MSGLERGKNGAGVGLGYRMPWPLVPSRPELHSQVSMRVILCGLCTRVDTHSHTGARIFASAGQHVSKFAPASAHSTNHKRDFLLPMHTIRDRYTQTRTCVCTYLCESEHIHTERVPAQIHSKHESCLQVHKFQ